MPFRWNPRHHASLAVFFAKWLIVAGAVGGVIGLAVAFFLWALDGVTTIRWNNPWLLYLLPAAGVAVGWLYHWVGKSVEAGSNLIVEQIHAPGGGVPRRMAPLVLLGTLITHLFGGSAGREGTAVQMGGSIASGVCRFFRLAHADIRILLMVGIAAGFGAVFGTPIAGALFAIEVLALGRMSYAALIPCLIGAVAGHGVTLACGIHHTVYALPAFGAAGLLHPLVQVEWLLLGKVAIAGVVFGLVSVVFTEFSHSVTKIFKWAVPHPLLRPALGGGIVIGLVFLLGTRDYLGLGVTADPHTPNAVTILSCFEPGGATWWSWFWKILFTAITLGAGFKGGEVTPLFFIGAALGNVLAVVLHAPTDLFAALGFVAVFAGATNTPLACTVMALELFGGQPGLLNQGFVLYAASACFIAYLLSGHSGIYLSQRIGTPKVRGGVGPEETLRTLRERQLTLVQWVRAWGRRDK